MRGQPLQQGMQNWQNMPQHTQPRARQMPQQQQMPPQSSMPPQQSMRAQMPQPQPSPSTRQSGRSGGQLPRLTNNTMDNPFSTPLPDGVKLVPLDENTMKSLHSIGANLPSGTQAPAANVPARPIAQPANISPQPAEQVSAPEHQIFDVSIAAATPPATIESLAKFIQNERNGTIFYSNLAKMTHSQKFQDHIAKISENCNARCEKLGRAYFEQQNEAFSPEQSAIEHSNTFTDGLRSAIAQEASAIHELVYIYEANTELAFCKLIDSQIYSKIADIALLNMMLSHK